MSQKGKPRDVCHLVSRISFLEISKDTSPLIGKSLLDSGNVPNIQKGAGDIHLQVQPMQASWVTWVSCGCFQLWLSAVLSAEYTYMDKVLLVCFPCAHFGIIYNDETRRPSCPRNTALQSARV